MGSVYRGEHLRTGRAVAIKLLREGGDTRRLAREARATALLDHPNVVDVLDMEEHPDEGALLVMELLQGQSLSAHLEAQGPLSIERCLQWLLPIMGALATAHDHGILHRDVKPSNIFLARGPGGRITPTLLDFGVASAPSQTAITRDGSTVGTPAFMAPEQALGEPDLTPAVDVWSMGVVWFRCLTGRLPFEGATETATLLRVASADTPRLGDVGDVRSEVISDVIERALQRSTQRRFADMRAFARALLAAASQVGIDLHESPDPVGFPDWTLWREQDDAGQGTAEIPALAAQPADAESRAPTAPASTTNHASETNDAPPSSSGVKARPVTGPSRRDQAPLRPTPSRNQFVLAALIVLVALAGAWIALSATGPTAQQPKAGPVDRDDAPLMKPATKHLSPAATPPRRPDVRPESRALTEEDF